MMGVIARQIHRYRLLAPPRQKSTAVSAGPYQWSLTIDDAHG